MEYIMANCADKLRVRAVVRKLKNAEDFQGMDVDVSWSSFGDLPAALFHLHQP